MRSVSEATRQIIEFEELVERLDRINNLHDNENNNCNVTTTSASNNSVLSVDSRKCSNLTSSYTSSPIRTTPYTRQDRPSSYPKCFRDETNKRVHVNIGIDEDLRMILEMDPSIVDRYLSTSSSEDKQSATDSLTNQTTVVNPSMIVNNRQVTSGTTIARPPRATRPQGWYWTRD